MEPIEIIDREVDRIRSKVSVYETSGVNLIRGFQLTYIPDSNKTPTRYEANNLRVPHTTLT